MQAVDILNKTTTLNDGDHYEMGLLWRRDEMSDEEASKSGPRTWYLPHFAVTSSSRPNKVRIVFHAAAEHR